MKIVRISDELHTKLKEHANIDRRTINGEAEIILQLYFADAEGGLTSEQTMEKRLKEALEVKEHIVNEGKELGILPKNTPSPINTDVSDLLKSPTFEESKTAVHEYQVEKKSEPTAGELLCCLNDTKPCKHWVWDVNTGEGYVNTLSGRSRDAE
jgi:hypothetical protein